MFKALNKLAICLLTNLPTTLISQLLNTMSVHFWNAMQQQLGVVWIRQVLSRFSEVSGTIFVTQVTQFPSIMVRLVWGRGSGVPDVFHMVEIRQIWWPIHHCDFTIRLLKQLVLSGKIWNMKHEEKIISGKDFIYFFCSIT